MRKYIIKKEILAKDIHEAIKREKKAEIMDIYVDEKSNSEVGFKKD